MTLDFLLDLREELINMYYAWNVRESSPPKLQRCRCTCIHCCHVGTVGMGTGLQIRETMIFAAGQPCLFVTFATLKCQSQGRQ
jgi:hypothetical protein